MNEIRCDCGKIFKDDETKTADDKWEEHFERVLSRLKGYKELKAKHRRTVQMSW